MSDLGDDIEPPFSVMLRIEPPEPPATKNIYGQRQHPLVPTPTAFRAWVAELDEKVRELGGRTVPIFGHEPDILTGQPRPTAYVNVWAREPERASDSRLVTWRGACAWALTRAVALEDNGYDVVSVAVSPGRHSVAIA